MDKCVTIVPYDPEWPVRFQEEATRIKLWFDPSRIMSIEHYGSTAVSGLAAKPTIGILVGMATLPLTSREQNNLIQSGYQFYRQLVERSYWRKYSSHNFTLAITLFGSETWFDHLAVRDYLRKHPEHANSYAAVKYQAIVEGNNTADSYRLYKKQFLEDLFLRAKGWQRVRVLIPPKK